MATSFSLLPIIDLSNLRLDGSTSPQVRTKLSEELYDVFATTGFAYLANAPLTFSHNDVFNVAHRFFALPLDQRMNLAKRTFQPANTNTYRGYFPVQPLGASDNLKEGFEIGANNATRPDHGQCMYNDKFNLVEPNVWPPVGTFPERTQLEALHNELQTLSSELLSLLAMALNKEPDFFASYLEDSLSTLRLLHYPPADERHADTSSSRESLASSTSISSSTSDPATDNVKLSCTPHTDSGILTLLHQDATGGLEVRNALGQWVAAPYVPGSIVVNIGDLMAEVSGGRFVATMHRVRAPVTKPTTDDDDDDGRSQLGRFSVPFFFEPGENCLVRSVDDDGSGHGILYGEHVRRKMRTWVEFQDVDEE